jgi:hypothetical protein
MPDEFPMNDPKQIWQNQPTEAFKMSAQEIRLRAQKLQMKSRLATFMWVGIGLFLAVSFGRAIATIQGTVPRIGLAILSLWGVYGAYHAYKWIWPGRLAPDATFATSLEFYRRELERKRDYGRHIWQRSGLAVCFLGMAILLLPPLVKGIENPRLLLNAAPFFTLLAIWFPLFFIIGKRQMRKLQKEIDEMNAVEKENRP